MNFFFILLFQVLVVFFSIELLVRYMPRALIKASADNSYRVDGTKSKRRSSFEHAAKNKVRLDLFAAFLFAAFLGNGIASCLHLFVVPIPTTLNALSLFHFDQKEWSDALESNRVESDFRAWSSANTAAATENTLSLKRRVAFVSAAALACFVVMLLGIKCAYLKSLHDFHEGIRYRREQHMAYDLGRIAMEAESYQEASN